SNELRNKGDYQETKGTEAGIVNSMLGVNLKINKYNSLGLTALYNHSGEKTSRYLVGERPEQIIDEDQLEGRGLSFEERQLFSSHFGGDHAIVGLNNAKLEWKVGYTKSSMDEPATRYFTNVHNTELDIYSIPKQSVQLPAFYYRTLTDDQFDAKIDFELPLGQNENKIKVGGLYTSKDRVFDEQLYQIFTSNFATPYAGDPDVFLGEDNIGIISLDETRNQYRIGNYLVDFTSPNNAYTGNNTVTAGYAMWKTKITSHLKMVAGARYEKTDLEVISGDENIDIEERTGAINQGDVLPVVNLIYATGEKSNFRAAYSKTLARPNMREIAPFVSYDPLTASFIIGNTDLKRTLVGNYDLRWEWFMNPGEIVAVSAYYKDFTDPISSRYLPSSNTEIKFINVDRAKVYGIELEFRKSLQFLSPRFKNLKFSSNLSLINSDVDVVKTSPYEPETRPFEGQAPYIVNAALLYDNSINNVAATLSLNYIGDRLRFLGQDGAPDIYDRARGQLDFNLQKKFGQIGLSLTAQNLLNSDFVISSDYKGKEYLYSRFKAGTSYSLGVSYSFR
ncbi:MAG: TonB-dependent receptor, partial [Saprospiraceae bacterium]|nr:TonB-dependent receptor [Saprospiraceae bacterium]